MPERTSSDALPQLRRELGPWDLALFNIVAAIGVQWISSSAHVGPISILLHLSAAGLFFIPSALAVATLGRKFPEEGGFYVWTRHAFRQPHAFLCGWAWWMSVLLYLPGLILTAAGMTIQVVSGDAVDENATATLALTLAVLWTTTAANIAGLRITKWLSNAGGTLIYAGGACVVAVSVLFAITQGPAAEWRIRPHMDWDRISLWAQIAFAYTGLELGTLLGGEVREPERTIPRAAWISAVAVTGAYTIGTLSLMLVLPPDQINPMTGLVDIASIAGSRLGLPWVGPLAAALLLAGIIGKLSAWSGGSARMPFVIGLDGAFPPAFARVHPRWRTPHVALIVQAAACTVFLVITQAGEAIRPGWQVLTDMAIISGFAPFVYIFLTAWKFGMRWSAASGLMVTITAILLSLVPPPGATSIWLFELKVVGGCALLLGLGYLAFLRATRQSRV